MLTDEPISSDVTVTLLQGPLRIPRLESHSPDVKNQEDAKYSTTLLLLCFYFLTRQDPHGHKIAWATLRPRAMSEPMEFWEHVGRYWDGAQWRQMLTRF
jgi:hypothetical protein